MPEFSVPKITGNSLKEGQADAIILIAVGVLVAGFVIKKVL